MDLLGLPPSGGFDSTGSAGCAIIESGSDPFLSDETEDLGFLPLATIWASGVSSLTSAGLQFDQWCNWIFSTPDLKVPSFTFIVELLGRSTILYGPTYDCSRPVGFSLLM